ncbi:MAG: M15 family metallopeptidase [Pseudomonadales bacterium]|nr:M15 family metallopeptidase [Pseudomonadales bacterium]
MMDYRFSKRSMGHLAEVHPHLAMVAVRALQLSPVDFGVTDGKRTMAEQKQEVAEGDSQTLNSRHLTGHAIDVMAYVDGQGSWEWEDYEQIGEAFKAAADEIGVAITWGGDWESLRDGPHFELSWSVYP